MQAIPKNIGTTGIHVNAPRKGYQLSWEQFEALGKIEANTGGHEITIEDGNNQISGTFDVVGPGYSVKTKLFGSNDEYHGRAFYLEKTVKDGNATYRFKPLKPGQTNRDGNTFLLKDLHVPVLPRVGKLTNKIRHWARKALLPATAAIASTVAYQVHSVMHHDSKAEHSQVTSASTGPISHYITNPGDTFEIIASLYNIDPQEVRDLNPGITNEMIVGGMNIVVPGEPDNSEIQDNGTYITGEGESLPLVADKLGINLSDIQGLNPELVGKEVIESGTEIWLPGSVSELPMAPNDEKTVDGFTFTQKSFQKIMTAVLVHPKGKLRGDQEGGVESDEERLKRIAKATGVVDNAKDVRYANLCGANTRAIWSSLSAHLYQNGYSLPYFWSDSISSGSGAGEYFSKLKKEHRLPPGVEVKDGFSKSPDPAKVIDMLLKSKGDVFVLSYTHAPHGHVHLAMRVNDGTKDSIVFFDPSWTGATLSTETINMGCIHDGADYLTSFVNGGRIEKDGKIVNGKSPNRYDLTTIAVLAVSKSYGKSQNPVSSIIDSGEPSQIDMEVYKFTCKHERGMDWDDPQWKNKAGKLRPGITKIIKNKKGKWVLQYPNDAITLDPGIDFGQTPTEDLRIILTAAGVNKRDVEILCNAADLAHEHARIHGTALKKIPEDAQGVMLTPEQLKKVFIISAHRYYKLYISPQIPSYLQAPIGVQKALMSIYFHRGQYWLATKFPEALKHLKKGDWYHPEVTKAIGTPKQKNPAMKARAQDELKVYLEGK